MNKLRTPSMHATTQSPHSFSRNSNCLRRAFSLLELLTVIAIVGALIAILIPGLTASREQAKAARCSASMKNIGYATMTYAADNRELLPPAAIDWHPSQVEFMRRTGTHYCDLPVNYGWAELLYEHMYPGAVVADVEEFAPGMWSNFPAQRNYKDKYGKVFNCPSAVNQESHAGHFRIYLPGWVSSALVLDEESRVERYKKLRIWGDSMRTTDLKPKAVLMGDAAEDSRSGDYEGMPLSVSCDSPRSCPSVWETSWINVFWVPNDVIVGGANPAVDLCGESGSSARFSHRHRDGANFLFGDLHVERSTELRHQLSCDFDLNGVPDAPSALSSKISGCEPRNDRP